jgi:hypothetical protein
MLLSAGLTAGASRDTGQDEISLAHAVLEEAKAQLGWAYAPITDSVNRSGALSYAKALFRLQGKDEAGHFWRQEWYLTVSRGGYA